MTLRRLYPATSAEAALSDDELTALYAWGGRSVALNIVTSLNGSLTAPDRTSNGLSNPTDRRILGRIRDGADAIVIGAATARIEQYASPANARLVLVTATGDLTGLAITDWDSTIVVAPTHAEIDASGHHPLALRVQDTLDAHAIVAALRGEGLESVLCEGGGRLAAAFAAARTLTEIFHSTAPYLSDAGVPWLTAGTTSSQSRLRLAHLLYESRSGTLYERWRTQESE